VREIGRGGMAAVYLARQLDLDRLVALKELNALRTSDPSVTQRFLREARVAGSLTHPNIVTVYEYFEQDAVPYISMEYIRRGSLRPFMHSLTPQRIGAVLEGVLAGLTHAERQGVVHRDIKPENLLVTDDGSVKIADFGIAKATNTVDRTTLTMAGLTVGTPSYMAPEQATAREIGPWTDLYALGVTTFEMLVGRTPFADTSEPMAVVLRQVNDPIPRVSDVAPRVPAVLSDWVAWLVAKDPAARPQSAAQAWDALEEALISLLGPRWRRGADVRLQGVDPRLAATVAPRTAPAVPPPVHPKRKRTRRLVPAIALLAAVVAAAAALVGGRSGGAPTPAQPVQQVPRVQEPAPTAGVQQPAPTAGVQQPSVDPVAPPAAVTPHPNASTPAGKTGKRSSRTAPAQTTPKPAPATTRPAASVPPAVPTPPTPSAPPPRTATTPAQPVAPRQDDSCAGDSSSDDPSDDSCGYEP
jgi:predicted Ser/Thr protein kinase